MAVSLRLDAAHWPKNAARADQDADRAARRFSAHRVPRSVSRVCRSRATLASPRSSGCRSRRCKSRSHYRPRMRWPSSTFGFVEPPSRSLLSSAVDPRRAALRCRLLVFLSSLGLVNTLPALILPFAVSAFGTFLLRQALLSVPDSLIEAASGSTAPASSTSCIGCCRRSWRQRWRPFS